MAKQMQSPVLCDTETHEISTTVWLQSIISFSTSDVIRVTSVLCQIIDGNKEYRVTQGWVNIVETTLHNMTIEVLLYGNIIYYASSVDITNRWQEVQAMDYNRATMRAANNKSEKTTYTLREW